MTSCCNLAVIGAITGYSGSQGEGIKKRDVALGALSFMLGTVVAMGILGALAGFVSQTIGSTVGEYWRIFAGFSLVLFGLASLKLIPFKLPAFPNLSSGSSDGPAKSILFGFTVGGGATACSACCNPVLPVVLGVVTLQGNMWWGVVLLGAFAIGWGLPLSAGLLGLGLGVNFMTSKLSKLVSVIRIVGGVVLLISGFYLLGMA
ncbi:MAG: sulfite exporter TauE/SafE family protein [candidate division Zixibacteria bacterium]|nr:sulfite exporter TauE/SafE family protein [candidate division Zixibacteria bacterium]